MRKQSIAFLLLILVLLVAALSIKPGAKNAITAGVVLEGSEDTSLGYYPPEEQPMIHGVKNVFIVEFKDPPVSKGIQTQGAGYADLVSSQHEQAKHDIGMILQGGGYSAQSENANFILDDYKYVFNGMALSMSSDYVFFIEQIPYVKRVFLSPVYHIDLNESVPLIKADEVWNLTDENGRNVTGENVTIAIIDTGVDYNHPDLGGCFGSPSCKVIGGYDFVNDDADPMDDNGHGTHVAATAAGNGTLKGVAPGAKIVAYKVCNQYGSCWWSDVIAAIENATLNNYSIMSMSLGGVGNPDDSLSLIVDNAVNSGIVATISAGNSGPSEGTIGSPGTSRKAITVGASDKYDNIASFSSRGPTSIGTLKPDVLAPGVLICAAEWDNAWSDRKCYDSQHVAISGTSMAAPHVAGVAALVLQMHKNWTPIDVKMAIRNTAEDLGLGLTTQGHGRVNALDAVNLSSRPCTAEFDTYNATYNIEGVRNFTGTALCDGFANYSVFISVGLNISSSNITSFSTEGQGIINSTNLTFSGNETKFIFITIPKIVDILRGQITIQGTNDSNGNLPFHPTIDVSNDGDIDWTGYHEAISQTQTMVGYYAPIGGNHSFAQSFNWTGGEIKGIALLLNIGARGDGILLEIRNGTFPSDLLYNITIPSQELPLYEDWGVFATPGLNLSPGEYWIVGKASNTASGSYSWHYSGVPSVYPGGFTAISDNYGGNWSYYYGDFAFKVIDSYYFDGTENLTGFEPALNNFLERCRPDMGGNCTVPIKISSINGTIRLSDLFIAYAGATTSSGGWLQIFTSASQVNDSTLFQFDAANYSDGRYILFLDVKGHNSSSSDYLFAEIDNFEFAVPEDGYLVKNGAVIALQPRNQSFLFKNYTLEYKAVNGSSWSLFKFANNFVFSSNSTVLGFFNATGLASGEYEIRATLNPANKSFSSVRIASVRVDKNLMDGWPQETDFTIYTSPKIADLDNDGKDEIVVATSRNYNIFESGGDYAQYSRSLYVFRSNGSVMPGWPKNIHGSFTKTPTLADLDGDGTIEIIYPSGDLMKLYVWQYNGSVMDGWPFETTYLNGSPTLIVSFPVVSDINNDGKLEVIFGVTDPNSRNGRLYAYSANGTKIWESSIISWARAAVGDVDADRLKEVLISSVSGGVGQLVLLNSTGDVMPGWPLNMSSGEYPQAYTLADLDGDLGLEIIYSTTSAVFALQPNGTVIQGWPRPAYFPFDIITSDLNNDNSLEVIVNPFAFSNNLSVFYANGSNFPGYPFAYPRYKIFFTPTVADVDGDGIKEILFGSHGSKIINGSWTASVHSFVYSFDYEIPNVTSGFPLEPVGDSAYSRIQESTPTIADIDNDGKAELVIGAGYYTNRYPKGYFNGGRLVVWETNKTYNSSLVEWGEYLNNIWNTNSYVDVDFDHVGILDNCPYKYNPSQQDLDNDTIGDACESVIGNLTDVNTTISNLSIKIGNSTNLSGQFNGTAEVDFYDNGTLFMNFTANFSNYSLTLVNVSIEKGKNGTHNYLIIKNLNISGTKTLYLPRSNSSSSKVCFIDNATVLLTTLLSKCTTLSCPGTSGNYSCNISNGTFVVSGFRHSALIESYSPPSGGGGGAGGGAVSGGGGVMVPPQIAVSEEEAQAAPVAEIIPATKKAGEEVAPAVEQPMKVGEAKPEENYLIPVIIVAIVAAAILFGYIEIKIKRKGRKFNKK